MKALLALSASALLLAACGGQSSPTTGQDSTINSRNSGSGTASAPAPNSTNTGNSALSGTATDTTNGINSTAPETAAARYAASVIAPDGRAVALNASGQVLYTRTINGSDQAFFYNGTRSIALPGFAGTLNSSGQVAGFTTDELNGSTRRGYLWSEKTGTVDLGIAPEALVSINGLNDAGQVVGQVRSANGLGHGFSWTRTGGFIDLGTLGGKYSQAFAVNNNGQVIGEASVFGHDALPDDGLTYPYLWTSSGGMVRIKSALPADYWGTIPTHINNKGQVVGYMFPGSGTITERAVFGTPAEGMTEIGTLGGESATINGANSRVTALNDAGQLAGLSTVPGGDVTAPQRGFFWEKATGIVDLGTLGGVQSFPADINLSGQVVGSSETAVNDESLAFIWTRKTGMVDLNTRLQNALPGMILTGAAKITDTGLIVASSNKGLVLLKPVSVK